MKEHPDPEKLTRLAVLMVSDVVYAARDDGQGVRRDWIGGACAAQATIRQLGDLAVAAVQELVELRADRNEVVVERDEADSCRRKEAERAEQAERERDEAIEQRDTWQARCRAAQRDHAELMRRWYEDQHGLSPDEVDAAITEADRLLAQADDATTPVGKPTPA